MRKLIPQIAVSLSWILLILIFISYLSSESNLPEIFALRYSSIFELVGPTMTNCLNETQILGDPKPGSKARWHTEGGGGEVTADSMERRVGGEEVGAFRIKEGAARQAI